MSSWKIIKGLLVTLVILFLALWMLISKGLHFILKIRKVLNENINGWFDSTLG
ncbi:hypothetical protein OIU83_18865 [Flavobacterium sp. LS1R49]|uniref:Uncharacterized protein n=1 Tax=Flavobacterium shii TaxID=2987687 RepID=A0A9X2ZI24_9FLAO|nr:hypothetical protein [Flavobacterium shii]MCV9929730.1 hypothetical protein [Flavobacterium shii]